MPEYIEFQQVMIDGVVIKMGSDRHGRHIVSRPLHGSEGINFLPVGKHDDTAGMLSRGSSHPDTALDDTVNLTVPFMYAVFLVVILHIAICRLIGQRTDGSGPEGLAFAEDNLRIVVGLTLILTGEV